MQRNVMIAGAVALAVVIGGGIYASMSPSAPASPTTMTTTARTPFYVDATGAQALGSFPANAELTITEATEGWNKVSFNGLEGWVQAPAAPKAQ